MTPIIALGLLSKEAVGDSCTLKFNKDCELLQYTGLKDKDGKEIYDGDIVTHWFQSNPTKIYWDNFNGKWVRTSYTGITQGDMELMGKVIGNIYENPELVDKEE